MFKGLFGGVLCVVFGGYQLYVGVDFLVFCGVGYV